MARRIDASAKRFPQEFAALMESRAADEKDVRGVVADIIAGVRARGDAALVEYTRKFDKFEATPELLRVTPQEIAQALSLTVPEMMKSLKAAVSRIHAYSEKQLPMNEGYVDGAGVALGWQWTPIDAVGLYVPGGTAAYPSSVLMNAIPARVAGVKRLAMVVPASDGLVNANVLAAAHVAGVEEIYKIGGAQAVAALAYGTETIKAVDKIVGPGNAYVAEAKRQVFGQVGIDMIAGPSEILVIADSKNNPAWIAADLLSQAEHDPMAQSILITDSDIFANKVEQAVVEQLESLPRVAIARNAWDRHGAIIVVRELAEAIDIANAIAPEHLELAVDDAEKWLPNIRHAGAVFLGRMTPEAIGDYIAGPSHVLPTSRTARFSSGLSVLDFMKRTSLIGCSPESFAKIGMYGEVMATQEGLAAHARSLSIRKPPPPVYAPWKGEG